MERKNFLLAGVAGLTLALTGCVSHYRDGGADYTGRLCVIGAKIDEEGLAKLFGV